MNKVFFILTLMLMLGSCVSENHEKKHAEEELRAQRMKDLKLKEKEVREKNKPVVRDVKNRNVDHRATIRSFFEAEKNRNINKILSFYSNDLKRYYNFNEPTPEQLKKEYRASWDRSSYAINENARFNEIDHRTYEVSVDYRFYQNSRGEEKTVKSTLRFVFDEEGKIREVYSL